MQKVEDAMLIGYVVGWKQDEVGKLSTDGYFDTRASVVLNMEIMVDRANAAIILQADRLKNPELEWAIFEVHSEADHETA